MKAILLAVAVLGAACQAPEPPKESAYRWERLTEHAAFPIGYNYPVHVSADGRFLALHPEGTFESWDGKSWTPSELPVSGLNSAYLDYVQHEGATYALGRHEGNYLGFTIDPLIQRTGDLRRWEQLGQSPSLPKLVFYGAASFDGSIWIIGGYDGAHEVASIWRSRDGLAWELATDRAPFGARSRPKVFVFHDRLWLVGGGILDGETKGDVWSSADGLDWRKEIGAISDPAPSGFTPVVFDDRIWLLGANRSGGFSSSSLVSTDGHAWTAVKAPWSPRGGVAAWTHDGALYMTGGKYSRPAANGELEFIYSNDVWRMTPDP